MDNPHNEDLTRKHLLFVYGTLKFGYHNNPLLARGRLVGVGVTQNAYTMRDVGFPALLRNGGNLRQVYGEVYRIGDATLRRIDQLEGNGHLYQRELVPAQVNGKTEQVWLYLGILPELMKAAPSGPESIDDDDRWNWNWRDIGEGDYLDMGDADDADEDEAADEW